MSLTRPNCTERPIRGVPSDLNAFTNAVLTSIANAPGLLGHKLHLSREFVFHHEGHHSRKPQEEALLCLEAVELWPECRGPAGHQPSGRNVGGRNVGMHHLCETRFQYTVVTDDQLFSACPGASEIFFDDVVTVMVELRNGVHHPCQ
ncbi:hypothetical protein NDU88_011475 [Pleurodeles waltl]|uniref:Uncharacterized protein n=1 Tax=Pleurodeles waltl TaxID=8319 RepID=A0AAV7PYD6_PLEWA|nr:hypothetical protein NDU88_011475 [Pleurodeles waltl]